MVGCASVVFVSLRVDFESQNRQIFKGRFADNPAVFADSTGEDQCVETRKCHRDAADFAGEPVAENFKGDLCALVPFGSFLGDGPHVVAQSRKPEKTAFLVHQFVQTIDVIAELLVQEKENRRVERAGARSHHKAVERCEAHRRIDTFSRMDCGAGASVAEMRGDEVQLFGFLAENAGRFGADVSVRCSVETVAADMVIFIVGIRNSVEESLARHRLVKRRVEDG